MFGRSQRPDRITSRLSIESLETRRLLAADLVALSPADDATTVAPDGNLTLTFSDEVRPGPGVGRILIKNAADDSVVEALDVKDPARVTFSGHTVTLDPLGALALPNAAELYVTIDAGAIRDLSTKAAEQVIFREAFETSHLLDSELDRPQLDNYALFMNGTLDVQTAGNYRFGFSSSSSGYLAIDLNGDGQANIADPADRVIYSDAGGLQFSEQAVSLAKGQYKFEYLYSDYAGYALGEVFYAADDGTLVWDPSKFAVVGDASQGIGLTANLITATTYVAAPDTAVDGIETALNLRAGNLPLVAGYPVQGTFSTANVSDYFPRGQFPSDHRPPQVPPIDPSSHNFNPDMPAGWSKETNVPQPQPVYDGWTQLDKSFWIAQQGGQGRQLFERGQGVVAVIDPDAFDDFSSINDGVEPEHNLEGYMTLPPIKLTDVAANSVKLQFDSSFRPESASNTDLYHPDWIGQTGLVDVSFDGGATWQNVLLKNSITDGPDGSNDHTNEHLVVNIPNPAGGSLLIRFGVVNSQNNWWWAVDNIEITGNAVGDLYEGIADRTTWNFTTLPEPLAADFNADGKVDLNDFGILKQNFATGDTKAEGDANGDARVDLTDFGILKVLISSTPPPAAPVPSEAQLAAAMHLAFAEVEERGSEDPLEVKPALTLSKVE